MQGNNLPVLTAIIGAVMWGLLWLPIRLLEEAGLHGIWSSVALTLGTLPILAPLAFMGKPGPALARKAVFGALLTGTTIILYGTSLVLTDVVRAVLLFYMAPVWSTIIECVFMGRRWTRYSTLALLFSFTGVVFIFRGNLALTDWNTGDILAAAAGLGWAIGTALIFTGPPQDTRKLVLLTAIGGLSAAIPVVLSAPDFPPVEAISAATSTSLGFGLLYFAPVLLITIWSAQRLPPALMSFLLTAEIISGVVSSAIMLDEPFGWPEAIGALLVGCGAVVEVIAQNKRARSQS
ncbi:DMT family transporter [Coralliovum pocilloporae]|uniref:DMT family transporter n=1 Tax=Coralliovum pocilloporae TaxID=3066369 RepID=UPI0033074998